MCCLSFIFSKINFHVYHHLNNEIWYHFMTCSRYHCISLHMFFSISFHSIWNSIRWNILIFSLFSEWVFFLSKCRALQFIKLMKTLSEKTSFRVPKFNEIHFHRFPLLKLVFTEAATPMTWQFIWLMYYSADYRKTHLKDMHGL